MLICGFLFFFIFADAGEVWTRIWGAESKLESLPVVGMEHTLVTGGVRELIERGKTFAAQHKLNLTAENNSI